MLKTCSYVLAGDTREIKAGEQYYFGELWDGNGDGEELLDSGAICVWDEESEEFIVDFEIAEEGKDLMSTLVNVTSVS